MSDWIPPWRDQAHTTARVFAVSSPDGSRVVIETHSATPGLASWLKAWIGAHLSGLPDAGTDDPDFTFVYVVLGSFDGAVPDGQVDGTAVLEAGYGGWPVGPEDGEPTTLAVMFEGLASALC
jgi:hypothetical protein